MTVPLDRQHVAELHGAEPRDPAHVVAAEVHEHDVFGPLLEVLEEFFREERVFLWRLTAPARPCEGANDHLVALDPAHDFR